MKTQMTELQTIDAGCGPNVATHAEVSIPKDLDWLNPMALECTSAFLEGTGDDWNYVLPTTLHEELKAGNPNHYFILDTRRPEEFAKGHIEGATNIFWLDVLKPQSLRKLPRDQRIIIACYVGHTASQVMVLLRLLGFDVRALKFGMGKSPAAGVPVAGWDNYGFDTVKSPA